MERISEGPAKEGRGRGAAVGCIAALVLFGCLCAGLNGDALRQELPFIRDHFPTGTPTQAAAPTATLTATPAATALEHHAAPGDKVITDDFADNRRLWYSNWTFGNTLIKNGQLNAWVVSPSSNGIMRCQKCPGLNKSFYIEAEFSTDHAINGYYGLVFNFSDNRGYLFVIDAGERRYALYRMDPRPNYSLEQRTSRKSLLIKPYPATNKLAVNFDQGSIDLYINDEPVDSYQDPGTDLASGEPGFYVGGTDFTLLVDNLFAYGK